MNNSVISIDLAKNVFQVCEFNRYHKSTFNKKVRRNKLLDTVRQLEPKRIVMEACYSANYWGRVFESMGYDVNLIPPHQVKPFVVGNKNDHNDALAIGEASFRDTTVFVRIKTLQQQDMQSLHRIRDRFIKNRTAIANQMRGLLSEYGIIIERRLAVLRKEIPFILEDAEQPLTVIAREFTSTLYEELRRYDELIAEKDQLIKTILETDEAYQRIREVPGVGPIVGSAILSAVGDAKQFKNGRNLAAWIGLTPKQYASGDNSRMTGMSKRGNRNLRRMLLHGARAVVNWSADKTDALSLWIQSLSKRMHFCKVVVAVANKLARMIWAVLAKGENYRAPALPAT
jgi:transposase